MTNSLHDLERKIATLRRGIHRGRTKPHKPIMLLTVLDLFDRGHITHNRVRFDHVLVRRFSDLFGTVRKPGDWCQPAPPFFHLRTSGFWLLKPRAGRESAYAALTTSGGYSRRLVDNVEYAYLDCEAFAAFSNPQSRLALRDFILRTFFTHTERARLRAALCRSTAEQGE